MTCPYTLLVAATLTCHPTLNDAMHHGLTALLARAESVTVEDVRRGRTWRLIEVTQGYIQPHRDCTAVEFYLGDCKPVWPPRSQGGGG